MSKWGSWVSGAVAGLENSLDRVLADDEQASAKKRAEDTARKDVARLQKAVAGVVADQPKSQPSMTSSSRSRTNDRLQERLAKAMVNKEGRSSSRTSTDIPSRTGTPVMGDTARSSIDSKASDMVAGTPNAASSDTPQSEDKSEAANEQKDEPQPSEGISQDKSVAKPAANLPITEDHASQSQDQPQNDVDVSSPAARVSNEQEKTSLVLPKKAPETSLDEEPPKVIQGGDAVPPMSHTTLEDHKNEVNAHLERIDALQTKLNYLSDQLALAAKATAEAATTGSPEKKIAEKDHQIAELMKEGQTLAKKELQHSNLIKKLRLKIGGQDREITDMKRRLTKAEQSATEERERVQRAEATEKHVQEKLKMIVRIEKDIDEIRREKETNAITILELRKQLSDSLDRADKAEKKAQSGALENERRVVAELKDELADSKIEKKLAEDRAKAEIRDIKDEANRQSDRAKVNEMELKSEIANLETKLEVSRARTEEVSSTGDAQTKLLRQIETLQTQYALASENWQGIESTLTSRVVALEKERDDVTKRESEVRRKARDINSKARKLEDDLEAAKDRARALEKDVLDQHATTQRSEAKANETETNLADARVEFDRQKKIWETELAQRLEVERAKWKSEMISHQTPTDSSFLRAESPSAVGSFRKHSNSELAGLGLSNLHSRRTMGRNTTSNSNTDLQLPKYDRERPDSRRSSALPVRSPEIGTPKRQDSTPSLSQVNGSFSQTPSIQPIVDEEYDTTSSHRPTINDVISASTTGAGPSVQLVERMSAAVRRLESEKVATKEEMARMVAQRDEARNEVVSLMREVDQKRVQDERVTQLEEEVKKVDARYQTTLEMLGEKSERVEELTIDVQDLKKIYRDLVEQKMT